LNQPLLLVAFGALAAALLCLLALPLVRRRAEAAARLRLEGAMPMSLEAVEAVKDGLRAEHALAQARFEQETQELRDAQAGLAAAAGRAEMQAGALSAERDDLAREKERLENQGEALRSALAAEQEEGRGRDERLDEQGRTLAAQRADIARLGRELEETTYRASSRQIDLVAREGELETLGEELAGAKAEIARLAAALAEAAEAATREGRAAGDAKQRSESLTSEIFSAEGRIERGRTETERLRAELQRSEDERERIAEKLVEARKDHVGLEIEFAALSRQLSQLFPGTVPGGDPATGLRAAAAERDRIEARLAALGRENRELRTALDRAPSEAERSLREEMLRLAAEVAALVAALDGPDGPVDRALAAPGPQEEGAPPSLADRIERLRARVRTA
jgi:chromosome segregation ATPase